MTEYIVNIPNISFSYFHGKHDTIYTTFDNNEVLERHSTFDDNNLNASLLLRSLLVKFRSPAAEIRIMERMLSLNNE